ncbi:MAG: TIGR02757 family protein [Acidobacteria bacterium]|nr:TIGR02757 family protein [Acidobacteriota bacterium]
MPNREKLQHILTQLSDIKSTVKKVDTDPVVFPRRYPGTADRETVALIAASFAFGKVSGILKAVEKVLTPLGPTPADTLRAIKETELKELYSDFNYRFVRPEGLTAFLAGIRHILLSRGTLNPLVIRENPLETADNFYRQLLKGSGNRAALCRSNLLADPKRGGPAKRWMLFLRWMVREKAPDFGIWKHLISPSELIIPLDTHILRISRYLGFTGRKSPSMRAAMEITRCLAELDPADPLRFDYAIAHLGIDGICPREQKSRHCEICPLQEVCSEGRIAGNTKSKEGLNIQ